MKKWGSIAIAMMLLAIVVYVLVEPSGVVLGRLRGEAFFEGRPTSYWARSLTAGPKSKVEAIARLEQGKSDAAAVLIELLHDTASDTAELRWTAAEILGGIGPAAQAGPALLAALEDPDPHVRAVAARWLAAAGVPADDAVPALTKILATDQKIVAARALSEYRGEAKSVLPVLVDILTDTSLDSETRWNAARTIGKIGPDAAAEVPVLVDSLEDEFATVREHAAEALGDIGPLAGDSVPALVSVLDDPATRVRRDAVRSLGQIGEAAVVAVPEIVKLLDDPEEIVRDAARNTLQAIAPDKLPPESGTADEADAPTGP
jgi:HEAT repeat protein